MNRQRPKKKMALHGFPGKAARILKKIGFVHLSKWTITPQVSCGDLFSQQPDRTKEKLSAEARSDTEARGGLSCVLREPPLFSAPPRRAFSIMVMFSWFWGHADCAFYLNPGRPLIYIGCAKVHSIP
jgi:hypothetical protein